MSERTYYQGIAGALKRYDSKGLVVDYGAGWGGLSELLIAEGFRVQGVEPSDTNGRTLSEKRFARASTAI